jgi:aldose 1-epimerase
MMGIVQPFTRCLRCLSIAALGAAILTGFGCEATKKGVGKLEDRFSATKAGSTPMSIVKSDFGTTPDGQAVDLYTLSNGQGLIAKITTYGAIVTELHAPDKAGKTADVVLGFDNLAAYVKGHPFFGAIAGRYANRIAKGMFTLEGRKYALFVNNGPNSLHGGKNGFDKVVWKAEPSTSAEGPSLKLSYVSKDGEEGYPGALSTTVTYTLTVKNGLQYAVDATTDKPTVLNITNHSYFNLAGENGGTILDHILTLHADQYTPVDETQIPTGELKAVKGTPMDFTSPHPIGERIAQIPGGYDHNYVLGGVLNGGSEKLARAGKVKDPKSGRTMEIWTTQPGVQLYTANFLQGDLTGIGGKPYLKNGAFCLETQHFPDSPNHPDFPTTLLNPGEKYHQVTVYQFGAE